ncbi:aspartate aminotransferase family protein [Thiomicrorhabdus arctica]|uniref:aspartate aminotransferase family protein n=1 Tax=Thiomicrorhabdus arctica TaxID=131540 RepID=UPI000376B7E5|nr:aspartate aminotransferase family protein [Thiomicrorhabdus arctica]
MDWFATYESDIRAYSRVYPAVFVKGDNARQTDEEGREYIDFYAGAGVLNFGHNNPGMTTAIVDYLQSGGVIHTLDMMTPPKREFIKAFVETILKPREMDYKLQFMGPTGTNAVEAALKLARKVTQRETVVSFTQGFHGMTLGALSCTANHYFRQAAGVPLLNVSRCPFETHQGGGIQALDTLRAMYQNTSSGVEAPAAFIVETIQAEGGVNVASKEWMQALQTLCQDFGSLLIVDDIQAGCGRTGQYFSFDDLGVEPDIITLAKGLGGMGTPMAMNLVKPEHDKHWLPGEHTGTFRGQNISFIAGREALRYFEDDTFMLETQAKGEMMRQELQEIADSYPEHDFVVRGKGMMQAIDVGNGTLSKAIAKDCFENGMLFGPCGVGGEVMKMIPPLTIPEKDLKQGFIILKEAVDRQIKLLSKAK